MQTRIIKIHPVYPDLDLIKDAAGVLQKGGLVAFPTETVYGIGANFSNKKAIDRLYKIKERPRNKPFTFHIADFEALKDLDIGLSEKAERIVRRFWPGPLTVLANNKKGEKIGVRMPSNKIALLLIDEAGCPVVAPSANISGGKPPVSSEDVISGMKGALDVVIDAGFTEIGVESSIVDVTTEPFTILREGAIARKDLLIDYYVLFVCTGNTCRSVMAKAMLEKFVREAGLSEKVVVDSAGTASYPGVTAAPNTIEVMKEQGVDVSMHRGKAISTDLLRKSDFIFVMERGHRDMVLNKLPSVDLKLRLLKENEDIPDPIGKSVDEYRKILGIIRDQAENIFLEFFKKLTHV